MYVLALLVVSVLIFALLTQLNGLLALTFLLAALIFIPALVLHRREAAVAPELGADQESAGRGLLRLAQVVGTDTAGIVLGVLFVLLVALVVLYLGKAGHPHSLLPIVPGCACLGRSSALQPAGS